MTMPLYTRHLALHAEMTGYAGFSMPLHYGDILGEHRAVREACGLFDCSHMGEFFLEGPKAAEALEYLLTNRITGLPPGRARYALLCNAQGGTVDDVIVYCLAPERYMMVVNAANREKDAAWLKAHLPSEGLHFRDQSDGLALLALQGPHSEALLTAAGAKELPRAYFSLSAQTEIAGIQVTAARTGYTGEDGFELFCDTGDAEKLWDALLDAGAAFGLKPCGLGARDTLRLEASLPLYGHELREDLSPLEAGLAFAVKMDKPDFIGKAALSKPPKRRLTGLRATGRGILREGCEVFSQGTRVGVCSSGTFCPTLGTSAALAFMDGEGLPAGSTVEVRVRTRMVEAVVVPLPLYKRK